MAIDRIEIYEATVPRYFPFPHIEDRINATERAYEITARVSCGLYWEGEYDDYCTIIAAENKFHIHPGLNRYMVSRVVSSMPEAKALIINRWNTSFETIKKNFPDAKLYRESFSAFLNFRDVYEPGEGTLLGHGIKPYKDSNKDAFFSAVQDDLLFNRVDQGLEVLYNGERKIILGNTLRYKTVEIEDIYDYVRQVLIHFTDFE